MTNIPSQDNYHDCGLYTLTYMEFFAYRTPAHVHLLYGPRGKKDTGVEIWSPNDDQTFPNFLQRKWFKSENGSRLRRSLMYQLLSRMCENQTAHVDSMTPAETTRLQSAFTRLDDLPSEHSIDRYAAPAFSFEPIHRLGRPENHLFLLLTIMVSGSKYP